MFDRIIQFSLSHRLLVIFAYIVLSGAGIYVMGTLPVDVFPEFAPPQVVIQTQAPGMSPQDVESLVTFPIETAINGTPNVESVRSSSSVGLSTVLAVFKWGTNIYQDRQLVNERLQTARERFPVGVEPPVMLPVTSAVGWLVKYSLTSDTVSALDLRTYSDWVVRPRILAIPGIASVVSIGGGVKQYQVEISPEKLRAYNLTLADAVRALEETNRNAPGGFLIQSGQEYIVTGLGRIRANSLADVENTVVAERAGTPILVSHIATVRFGEEVKRGDGALMEKPAVIGTISKLYGADTLTTTYAVERALDGIRATLPPWDLDEHSGVSPGDVHRAVNRQPERGAHRGWNHRHYHPLHFPAQLSNLFHQFSGDSDVSALRHDHHEDHWHRHQCHDPRWAGNRDRGSR